MRWILKLQIVPAAKLGYVQTIHFCFLCRPIILTFQLLGQVIKGQTDLVSSIIGYLEDEDLRVLRGRWY